MAVFLLATALAPLSSMAASSVAETDIAAAPAGMAAPVSDVANEIAIEMVAPGQEGLELSAKLLEGGGTIERPIGWTVSTASGEKLYTGDVPVADASLPPGDYRIDIRYGAAQFTKTLKLLQGNRLAVSFVLNVGGIRVLPQVSGLGLPAAEPLTRIYALGGIGSGQIIAESHVAGEIIRVPAGSYRIESRFTAGNVFAVTDVTVRPGKMSAVEIDHAAGLARLSFVGAPDVDVTWSVAASSGEQLATASGLSADVVLKPGTYVASATTGGEVMTATFAIAAGEARDIILGN